MKLAIICDDLIQKGGAERVVEAVSDVFPDSPIYTSVASEEWLEKYESKNRKVITSFLQKFPFSIKLNRYYSPFLFHILAFESFDLSEFDVVLSISSRYSHFVITKPETKHICYINSPGRMFWEPFDYFEHESFGLLRSLRFLSKPFLKLPLSYIRLLDLNASKKVDVFVSNSKTVQKRVKKYYGKDSKVVYPFIDFNSFKNTNPEDGDYYLVLTRLSSWKRVDIAVSACEDLGEKLKIIGEGPDLDRLRELSGLNTDFLGYVSEEEKINVIRKCKAVIITQKEDFGIVPLEVMACGKPIIAFESGGATETIVRGVTGEFFDDQTSGSLRDVIKSFDTKKYNPTECKNRASQFDLNIFINEIKTITSV